MSEQPIEFFKSKNWSKEQDAIALQNSQVSLPSYTNQLRKSV